MPLTGLFEGREGRREPISEREGCFTSRTEAARLRALQG